MIRSRRSPIEYFVLSHKGLVRSNNEDSAAVQEIFGFRKKKALLAVLADGVGGHNAGEIASQIAVETITAYFKDLRSFNPHSALESAIIEANNAILNDIDKNPDRNGMGTTCVSALIIDKTLYIAHLGDSRLYIQRGRSISRLTSDHTVLEDYKHLTILHPDNVTRSHPLAHVLSRYLGSTQTINVDNEIIGIGEGATKLQLHSGDILLLCSDGLTDLLTDEEIKFIIQTHAGRKRAQFLVYRALEKGGYDNTTVIVIKIP